jgi:hypothetical protein
MRYERNVLGQCEFSLDGVSGTATLVESRAARVTRRVEIVLDESGKTFSIPVELARQRGFWNDEKAVWVPRAPDELLLFALNEIESAPPPQPTDPAVEALFGKLVAPPQPRPRREHAGGVQGTAFEGDGDDRHATGTVDFDYDEVDARLGFDADPEVRERGTAYGAGIVLELLNWLQGDLDKGYGVTMHGTEKNVFIRVQVLRYYLDRETMGAPTLEQLKRRLGVSRETLRFLLDDLEKRYGLVSPLRKSAHARRALSNAARPRYFKG